MEIEYIKKNQSEIKNAVTEIKNILEGINSRLHEVEDRINLEDKVENTQTEQQQGKQNSRK